MQPSWHVEQRFVRHDSRGYLEALERTALSRGHQPHEIGFRASLLKPRTETFNGVWLRQLGSYVLCARWEPYRLYRYISSSGRIDARLRELFSIRDC